jgi:hypothetical protein
MKRASSGVIAAILAAGIGLRPAVAEVVDDKTERIKAYADRALDFAAEGSASYSVKRGGKPISDMDLATTSGDPDLPILVETNQIKGRLYRAEIGALSTSVGLLVGFDNFFGNRPAKQKLANFELPASILAPYVADDWRSFALSAAGAALAIYGAWQIGELIGEAIGSYKPRYLSQETVKRTVEDYNKALISELGLVATDVATVTLAASPSPTPPAIPESFPDGVAGSAAWALRKATGAVRASVDAMYRPYLAYTRDIVEFEPGLVQQGDWHVVMAASESVTLRDIDVTVPRFGGGPTWRDAGPEWTQWRSGTDLLARFEVDSPNALGLLGPEYLEKQVGWLRPGSTVVLYPYYYRLKDPLWMVFMADNRVAPWIGVNARSGNLVNLARYR